MNPFLICGWCNMSVDLNVPVILSIRLLWDWKVWRKFGVLMMELNVIVLRASLVQCLSNGILDNQLLESRLTKS